MNRDRSRFQPLQHGRISIFPRQQMIWMDHSGITFSILPNLDTCCSIQPRCRPLSQAGSSSDHIAAGLVGGEGFGVDASLPIGAGMQDIEGLRAQTARRLLERVEIAVGELASSERNRLSGAEWFGKRISKSTKMASGRARRASPFASEFVRRSNTSCREGASTIRSSRSLAGA